MFPEQNVSNLYHNSPCESQFSHYQQLLCSAFMEVMCADKLKCAKIYNFCVI